MAVEALVSQFPELEIIKGAKRVRCKLSGHEMPLNNDEILKYTKGRKFTTLKKESEFSFHSYEPFIVPSEKKKGFLFCTLTGKYMKKIPLQVEAHIKGKNYIYQKALYDVGKKQLINEVTKEHKVKDEGEKESGSEEEDTSMIEDEICTIGDEMQIDETKTSTDIRKRKLRNSTGSSLSNKKMKLLKKRRRSIAKEARLIGTK